MNTDPDPESHQQPHDLRAFFEFFGCTLLGAFILHPLLRLVIPTKFFDHYWQTFAALSFLICGGICAWVFDYVARRRKRWPFD